MNMLSILYDLIRSGQSLPRGIRLNVDICNGQPLWNYGCDVQTGVDAPEVNPQLSTIS